MWLIAGASTGGLLRHLVEEARSTTGVALLLTVVLTTTAAALIGFVYVMPVRQPVKTTLLAAGGTAGSISASATRAASATAVHAAVGLAGYFAAAVAGFAFGVLVALSARTSQRQERY